jgi:hypothetical protein
VFILRVLIDFGLYVLSDRGPIEACLAIFLVGVASNPLTDEGFTDESFRYKL